MVIKHSVYMQWYLKTIGLKQKGLSASSLIMTGVSLILGVFNVQGWEYEFMLICNSNYRTF